MTEIKKGDRVRVTIEGEVTWVGSNVFTIRDERGRQASAVKDADVEVLAPPVETFKPGDTVRNKRSRRLLTLAESGFLNHHLGKFFGWGGATSSASPTGYVESIRHFTSERYERVEV